MHWLVGGSTQIDYRQARVANREIRFRIPPKGAAVWATMTKSIEHRIKQPVTPGTEEACNTTHVRGILPPGCGTRDPHVRSRLGGAALHRINIGLNQVRTKLRQLVGTRG